MSGISNKVRAAMERLDQAVDRLDTKAAGAPPAKSAAASSGPGKAVLAERLDRMIERIESALAS